MRKTALLTGVAGLFLMTAPAFAQDTAPQTPPPATTPPAAAADPAAPQSLTLQPGANVKGSDGAVIGQLEGARTGAAGQELTIRGADGKLRAVPVSGGVRQDGADIAVGWTSAQFSSAPAITEDATAPAATPAAPATPDATAPTPAPTTATPPAGEATDPAPPSQAPDPMTPDKPGA